MFSEIKEVLLNLLNNIKTETARLSKVMSVFVAKFALFERAMCINFMLWSSRSIKSKTGGLGHALKAEKVDISGINDT